MNQTMAIIGYGAAAVNAIIALRSAGYAGKIQVFSDAGDRPYSPMMTASYAAGTCDYEGMFPWDTVDLDQLNVDVVPAKVVVLDADAHTIVAQMRVGASATSVLAAAATAGGEVAATVAVAAAAGSEASSDARVADAGLSDNGNDGAERCKYAYDVCLVASGAHPRRAAWETASELPEGARPLVLRTLRDADLLKEALISEDDKNDGNDDNGDVGESSEDCGRGSSGGDGGNEGGNSGNSSAPHVLVSGASMVALKAVDACLARGVKVTLLCRGGHIMGRTACSEVALALETWLIEKGVDVRLSQVIEETEALGNGRVRITFSNGDVADYSGIVLAHGVVPNLEFLDEAAFNPEDTGAGKASAAEETAAKEAAAKTREDFSRGLPVDEFMRTQLPHVYAAGDVARVLDFSTGAYRVAGLWKEACLQGAAAGHAMAAELAGEAPSADRGYCGFIPSNCITVGGAVVLSAGSVSSGLNRWTEIVERNECLIAAVYEAVVGEQTASGQVDGEQVVGEQPASEQAVGEQTAGEQTAGERPGCGCSAGANQARLVGYGVFSEDANPATSNAYDEAAMLYRRMLAQEA